MSHQGKSNIITESLDVEEGASRGGQGCNPASFAHGGRERQAKKVSRSQKGKEMNSPLELSEGNGTRQHLEFSPVRPLLDL